ncbi:MAG TPA: ACP S-malonyltransferase [Clostridiales bacterium]|nr:ACP S-malonyltransferase [Clostridiales bacterium]
MAEKIAFVFPGQGAQYVGMGKDIVQNFNVAKDTFEMASEVLGFDVLKLCMEGPEEQLIKTEITQPSILTVSIAVLNVLRELGMTCHMTAGLSLGEYTALVCANALDFEDAVGLVNKRGRFMQEAVPEGEGGMAAIIGLDAPSIQQCCQEAKDKGIVEVANYNCPGQIVIAGQIKAVEYACQSAKQRGAKRTVMLPVSAPFHTSMLKDAGDRLSKELEKVEIRDMEIPVVTNVTGEIIENKDQIKDLLIRQVSNSILWEKSVRTMVENGVNTFVEIGPGKALNGFIRKIDRNLKVANVEDMNTLKKVEKDILEGLK